MSLCLHIDIAHGPGPGPGPWRGMSGLRRLRAREWSWSCRTYVRLNDKGQVIGSAPEHRTTVSPEIFGLCSAIVIYRGRVATMRAVISGNSNTSKEFEENEQFRSPPVTAS